MEAVARMRCSKGLTVERYLGSFHRRTATDIDLPAVNTDQSIAVQLRHEDKLDKEAFLQFVVLYSTTQGERRIRQALLPQLHCTWDLQTWSCKEQRTPTASSSTASMSKSQILDTIYLGQATCKRSPLSLQHKHLTLYGDSAIFVT